MKERWSQPPPHPLLLFVVEEPPVLQLAGPLEPDVLGDSVFELSDPSPEPFAARCVPES